MFIKFIHDPGLQARIHDAIIEELNSILKKNIVRLRNNIKDVIKNALYSSPEYYSLIGGALLKEMGLVESQAGYILDTIIETFANDTQVTIIGDRIIIDIGLASFENILNLNEASHQIPWLDWLILKGTRVLVEDAGIVYGKFLRSRSGGAIMLKSAPQKFWRVPPQYAGTANDNFITRALVNLQKPLTEAIKSAIIKV